MPLLKNPPWTEDELILALDVYFQYPTTNKNHIEIHNLSKKLNVLPIHPKEARTNSFRNPQGVYMKLMNFKSLDPSYEGTGFAISFKA